MKKLLGYILTPVFLIVFGFWLVLFHIIQILCLNLLGYSAHKKSVDILNLFLLRSLWLLGCSTKFERGEVLSSDRPIIIVSNHQSMYDIPAIIWYFRKHHVKFVSKIELSKGVPSISYNLRHGGSVVIDRKDPKQALSAIMDFGKYVEKNNYAAVIFPEGTRSKDGVPKKFKPSGLKTLIKYIPNALIVPVSINNSWRLLQFGMYPMSAGEKVSWFVHPHIDPKDRDADEVIEEIENVVKSGIFV